ncbi:unnamed protein product [Symbiodinium natans]|uniref:C3H1-type domain-containing protein n=1 Tax=Symbiodinium natans TaxID=878477 RepID=A0A812RHB6_9DINO|nr:unnamed protein product [Symbiodinium natans]
MPGGTEGKDGASEECEELSGSSSSSWFHALRDSVQAALSDTPGASPVLSSDSEEDEDAPAPSGPSTRSAAPSRPNQCILHWSRHGCRSGDACKYCHRTPPLSKSKSLHRPRKQTRDKYKAAIYNVIRKHEDDLQRAQDELQEMAHKSPYLRILLHGILNAPEAPAPFLWNL